MLGEEQEKVAAKQNPLQSLLQGITAAPYKSLPRRNPLYHSGSVRQSKSRSNPSSPVSKKTLRATNKRGGGSCSRRGASIKSTAKYKPIPGLETEDYCGDNLSFAHSLKDFVKVDNVVFRSASAPCSPVRPQFAAQLSSQPAEPPLLHLSALCLNSLPESPQSSRSTGPACSGNCDEQQLQSPQLQCGLQQAPSVSLHSPRQHCDEPSPLPTDCTPSSAAHQLRRQLPTVWQSQECSPSSPPHALSPMQISPFPPETTSTSSSPCKEYEPGIMECGDEMPSGSAKQVLGVRRRVAPEASAPQPTSSPPRHLLPSQPNSARRDSVKHAVRQDNASRRPWDALEPKSTCLNGGTEAGCRPTVCVPAGCTTLSSPAQHGSAEAQPCMQASSAPHQHNLIPTRQELGGIAALADQTAAPPPKQPRRHEGGCCEKPQSKPPMQRGVCTNSSPLPVGSVPAAGHALKQPGPDTTLQRDASPPAALNRLAPSCGTAGRVANEEQQALHVDHPMPKLVPQGATLGRPPAPPAPPAPQHARSHGEAAAQRAAEDQAVRVTCPPLLLDVLRHFPTQREAFACADRCNSSQPLQGAPPTLMSRLAAAPEAQPPAGTGAHDAGNPGGTTGLGGVRPVERHGWSAFAAEAGSHPHRHCQQQQPKQLVTSMPGQQGSEQQGTHNDVLQRFAAGPMPASSGSQGSRSICELRREAEAARGPSDLGAQATTKEQARQAAKDMYRSALAALREPDPCSAVPSGSHSAGAPGWQGGAPAGPPQPAHTQGLTACTRPGMGPGGVAQQDAAGDSMRPGGAGGGWGMAASAGTAEGAAAVLQEEPVKVFCVEKQGRSGAHYRQFAAASYPAVWQQYRRTPMVQRHWYEVIREGRPCHLYFDLECPARHNLDLDMDGLVNCLLHHVDEALGQHFGLAVDHSCVYELDSSTEVKHSRHLVVRIPGHAFINNHAMGRFVAQVVAAAGPELMVMQSQEEGMWERGSVVDAAVYSRNRHLRMVWSCKGGKAAVLVPTRRFATQEGCGKSAADVFLDTLICRVQPSDILLQMPNPLVLQPSSHAQHAAALPVGERGVGGVRVAWKSDVQDGSVMSCQQQELKELAERAVPFIEQVAIHRAGGQRAKARTLAFCGRQGTVAYSMIGPGSHFCENIGRFHQSNHVFFVVNFNNGMFCQKCHDPDCGHFRSSWMPLPRDLRLSSTNADAMQ